MLNMCHTRGIGPNKILWLVDRFSSEHKFVFNEFNEKLQDLSMDISQLLTFSVQNGASDLHLSAELPPMIRVDGDVRRVNVPARYRAFSC